MRDGLGRIETVAVVGGGSEIGTAAARAMADVGARRFVLAGRPTGRRSEAAATVPGEVVEVDLDLTDTARLEEATTEIFRQGEIDVAILAGGRLIRRPSIGEAVEMAEVNYVGSLVVLLTCARLMSEQGHGQLVVLSSAGVTRPRPSNFVYGSTKVAVDFAARGLALQMKDAGVTVTVVRPSFVFTRMTTGMRPTPLAVHAEQVGEAIAKAVRDRVHGVVWVPRSVSALAYVLQYAPSRLVARLKG